MDEPLIGEGIGSPILWIGSASQEYFAFINFNGLTRNKFTHANEIILKKI